MNILDAFSVLMNEMKKDDEYAITWHSNVAMSFYDAGGDIKIANKGADNFMQLFFNVDMKEVRKHLDSNSESNI